MQIPQRRVKAVSVKAQASNSDPTGRFSNRVADYVRHRPGYPPAVLECLTRDFGLKPTHVVADIGSGTGIFTRMLLENGNNVFAIEPNDAMRAAAERELAAFSRNDEHEQRCVSMPGSAERTTLPDASVDWIIAAQAFHWFDVEKARTEALRVLRAPGRVALIWNDRKLDTPFLQAYERFLLEFGTDFKSIRHEDAQTDGRLERFFGGATFARRSFDNEQILDEEGLRGRTLSASYMPGPDHPRRAAMLDALHRLFGTYQENGRVPLTYETKLYVDLLT